MTDTPLSDETEVLSFEGGKYELRQNGYALTAWRHGEPWQDFTGNKFMGCLFDEVLRLRAPVGKGEAMKLTKELQDFADAIHPMNTVHPPVVKKLAQLLCDAAALLQRLAAERDEAKQSREKIVQQFAAALVDGVLNVPDGYDLPERVKFYAGCAARLERAEAAEAQVERLRDAVVEPAGSNLNRCRLCEKVWEGKHEVHSEFCALAEPTPLESDEEYKKMRAKDIRRLRHFTPLDGTDGLFDRNHCNRLEDEGLIKYVSGCSSGERTYEITPKGQALLDSSPKVKG